jgi:hypothetical protein
MALNLYAKDAKMQRNINENTNRRNVSTIPNSTAKGLNGLKKNWKFRIRMRKLRK